MGRDEEVHPSKLPRLPFHYSNAVSAEHMYHGFQGQQAESQQQSNIMCTPQQIQQGQQAESQQQSNIMRMPQQIQGSISNLLNTDEENVAIYNGYPKPQIMECVPDKNIVTPLQYKATHSKTSILPLRYSTITKEATWGEFPLPIRNNSMKKWRSLVNKMNYNIQKHQLWKPLKGTYHCTINKGGKKTSCLLLHNTTHGLVPPLRSVEQRYWLHVLHVISVSCQEG